MLGIILVVRIMGDGTGVVITKVVRSVVRTRNVEIFHGTSGERHVVECAEEVDSWDADDFTQEDSGIYALSGVVKGIATSS